VTDRLLTTPELAQALGLSTRSIRRYLRDGKIAPDITSPGGHHRWNLESVRAQLRALRERSDD
jgi:predicted site-specific integrase-resolvase